MSGETASAAYRMAEHLHSTYDRNNWGGSDSVLKLAAAKYAVIVERDKDGWILAADNASDLAGIALGTYTDTEGYSEWVQDVIRIEDGASATWHATVTVTAALDGESGEARGN